jgi:serine kinase of HPr protein (carbohydrate metabolism regulator)
MSDLVEGNGAGVWAATDFTGSVHAGCVAINGRGVMIGGPSGAGKSDLALRLIDRGAMLVSDDYTLIVRGDDGRIIANPAPNIKGLIEVRGIGIVPLPFADDVPIELVVIGTTADGIERMPHSECAIRLCGEDIPLLHLSLLEASAPLKVEMSLQQVGQSGAKAIER